MSSKTSLSSSPLATLPLLPSAGTAKGCARCEQLPAPRFGAGILHLRFPIAHSLGKVRASLAASRWKWSGQEGRIDLELEEGEAALLADDLARVLTAPEARDCIALFLERGQTLALDNALEAQSLWSWLGRARAGWLVDMIGAERLTSHFQPILDAQSGEIFAYEALLRGLDGEKTVPPVRLFEVANQAGMLFQLDLAARRSAIRNAAVHRLNAKIFINFTPSAIYDPVFCLKTTVKLIEQCDYRPEDIVFEVIESEKVDDSTHLRKILDFYRSSGFGVALDDLGSGFSGLNLLASLRPDYIKLDRELISGVDGDPYKSTIISKLLETAQNLGVRTVAEGIETREEWHWLRARGVDLMQGFLFARPALPPASAIWPE